jgi:chitinase
MTHRRPSAPFLSLCVLTVAAAGCTPPTDEELDDTGDWEVVQGEAVAAGTYTMTAVHSGKCAEVAGASLSDGANIQQWTCSSTKVHQRWKISSAVTSGYYRIQNANSNKCLDVAGRSTLDGAKIHQWGCHTGDNQQWQLRYYRGGGYYEARPKHASGKCMDVKGISLSDGALIHQWTCRSVNQQRWRLKLVSSTTPTPTPTPTPTDGLGAILSESMFNQMFPNRSSFYTYAGLIEAAKRYPAFATTGDLTTRKREVAAFLANVAHETGFLRYIEEINKSAYCSNSSSCPCASGQWYYGRGPIQLSWNYNYCAAGAALGYDLRADPGLVARNATVAWATGFWFWMTQTGAGRYTCHNAMSNSLGFGETIRTINGALECNGGNPAQVAARVEYYKNFCSMLGVTPGSNLTC